jgi:hypothetical protein
MDRLTNDKLDSQELEHSNGKRDLVYRMSFIVTSSEDGDGQPVPPAPTGHPTHCARPTIKTTGILGPRNPKTSLPRWPGTLFVQFELLAYRSSKKAA